MGIFRKIIEGFTPQLSEDEAVAIRSIIEKFNHEIGGLATIYSTAADRSQIACKWKEQQKIVKRTRIPRRHALYESAAKFLEECQNIETILRGKNNEFVDNERLRCRDLLADIDGKALDVQQQTVVVTNEDRTLVLAGAGSGKTLTIAGKVKYLCQEKGISPEDILLVAFTKKSAEEMTERIAGRLGIPVQATTFHKLGLDILTQHRGERPDVQDDLTDFIRNYFEEIIVGNPKDIKNLIEYFAYYLRIPADLEKFDSLGAAYAYERGADFETLRSKYEQAQFVQSAAQENRAHKRTLQNEQVKSLEEVSIANFLFLNGVQYEYERKYPFESTDPTRKAYRPDFYLPEYDIYLEHFGINHAGKLPWLSPIEESLYLEGMEWKRAFHKENGTTLLETYSHYASDGILLERLDKLLKANGVKYKEPDFASIFDSVYAKESDKYFSEFIGLCSTFITLFKSSGRQSSELWSLSNTSVMSLSPFYIRRTGLFLEIISPILQAYDAHLASSKAVDFSDMINAAASCVSDGFPVHKYKWVIIDEYQDISLARFKLVKAILDQTNAKLLCVGDDWQSIYRFAGSDISLFTQFERYVGSAAIMRLEQTYRNSQQLIDVASAFVMKNPQQYTKQLRSGKTLEYPLTFMCYSETPFPVLKRTIDKIIQDAGVNSSILILGRTNYDLALIQESKLFDVRRSGELIYKASPDTPISFMSVHRSKGLEADNVVLVNFENSTLGFPNKIADDPLLSLVLTDFDTYLYAEERRLLYVALTRTRNRVFVLVNENKPSEFLADFPPSRSVFILSSKNKADRKTVACPRCKSGVLMVRKNESSNSYFVGCSNFPHCDYTIRQTEIMDDTRVCPVCGGFLIKRRGKWGHFYGCSNYPKCKHTEEIAERSDTLGGQVNENNRSRGRHHN